MYAKMIMLLQIPETLFWRITTFQSLVLPSSNVSKWRRLRGLAQRSPQLSQKADQQGVTTQIRLIGLAFDEHEDSDRTKNLSTKSSVHIKLKRPQVTWMVFSIEQMYFFRNYLQIDFCTVAQISVVLVNYE